VLLPSIVALMLIPDDTVTCTVARLFLKRYASDVGALS
jgi:hypothetical protein